MRPIMRVVISLGLSLCLYGQTAIATSLEPLLQAAGLIMFTQPVPAIDVQLPDAQKRVLRLREQRGKVVFLNFWATWCPSCVHEMPMMEQLYQSLRQQPFVMWAVNFQESQEQVARFMAQHHLHFPALLDLEGTASALYMVRALPTTYLINCAGDLVGLAMGARQWTSGATRALLAALLSDTTCQRESPVRPAPDSGKGQ